MAGSGIEITLTARDQASAEIAKVHEALKDVGKRGEDAAKAAGATGQAFRETIQPLKLFTGSIAGELNPALGTLVFSLGAASREARSFGLGAASAIIGLAVLGASVAAVVRSIKEAATAQAEFNAAVASFDTSGLRAQITQLSKAADAWKNFSEGIGLGIAKLLDLTRTPGAFNILDKLFGRPDPDIALRALAAFRESLPVERATQFNQQMVALTETTKQLSALEAERARSFADVEEFFKFQAAAADAINRQADALSRVIDLEAQAQVGAAKFRGTLLDEGGNIEAVRQERQAVLGRQRLTQLRALEERTRLGRAEITATVEGVVAEPRTGDEEIEGLAIGRAAITDIRRTRAAQAANLEQIRLQFAAQRLDLTREERAQAEARLILAERDLAIAQSRGKEDQDALAAAAELTAREKIILLQQQEFERTDPGAGLRKSIRETVEEFGAAGAGMEQVARETATGMQRAFSDQFFDVMTGNFKDLGDVGKRFATGLVRTITDELARLATSSLLRSLGGLLAPGSRFAGVLPGIFFGGGGGGAGELPAPVGAGIGQVVNLSTGGQAVVTAGGGLLPVPGSGGGFGAGGLPTPPLSSVGSSFLPSGAQAFLSTPIGLLANPNVLVTSGGVISNAGELAAAGLTEAGVAGQSLGAFGQISVGGALGAAAGAVGLGFTLFSALTQPQTPLSIATNTVGGALSGAVIGSAFGPVGTAIGAIAGGLLGGGASFLGKANAKGDKRAREQAEAGRAINAGSALAQEVQGAATPEELFRILTKWGSGTVGGTSSIAIVTFVTVNGTAKMIGLPNSIFPVATVDELMEFGPDTFVASIQAGVNPSLLAGQNATIVAAVKQKIDELKGLTSRVLISFDETLAGGAVRRTTVLPLSRARLATGQQISVVEDTLVGLDDTIKVKFLLELARLDADHDLRILRREGDVDSVTVGRFSGATVTRG